MKKIEIPDLTDYPHFEKFINTKDKFILDKDKNVIPATLLEWGQFLQETHDERIVQQTDVEDLIVSTVFLGLDHSFDGSLHIFETMIFRDENGIGYCERYSTWKEAEEGHQRAIEWVKGGCKHDE